MIASARTVAVMVSIMVAIAIAVEAVAGAAVMLAIAIAVVDARSFMVAAGRARVWMRYKPGDIQGVGNVRRRHWTVIVVRLAVVARRRLEYRAAGQQRGRQYEQG